MSNEKLLMNILDSWDRPVVFCDTGHVIRYVNQPARKHYAKWGDILGKSIFDCHNEKSCRAIREIFGRMKEGETEVMITDSPKHRAYMRAVRGENNELLGYYERYEPPAKPD
jgi:hypothetical protein